MDTTNARRPLALIAALAAVLAAAPATAGRGRPSDWGCARYVNVRHLGPACRVEGGWRVLLPDGTTVLTHGPDPLPSEQITTRLPPVPRRPACVSDPETEFHVQVIYARNEEQPDRYDELVDEIRFMVAQANGALRTEAEEFGLAVNYRMRCTRGKISVAHVVLPTRKGDLNLATAATELRLLGYNSDRAKYWVWYDNFDSRFPAGFATLESDDSPGAENGNNWGPSYAIVLGIRYYAGGYAVFMHEAGHTMGAVQDTAPHSSGGFHCNDGLDIMCYDDQGYKAAYSPKVCIGGAPFDCRHDDYFNLKPRKGSYLADHWNIGSPVNRFLQGCAYLTGSIPLGLAGQQVVGTSLRTYRFPSSCAGHRFALSGFTPLPSSPVLPDLGFYLFRKPPSLAFPATVLPVPDFNVCWYRGSRALRCYDAVGTDVGVVPKGATAAKVTLLAGVAGSFVLSVL